MYAYWTRYLQAESPLSAMTRLLLSSTLTTAERQTPPAHCGHRYSMRSTSTRYQIE
nr:hypothetical protein RNT25_02614 [arsenite-oxidising bacterium NT-25]